MVGSGSNYVYVTQSNPYWEYSPTVFYSTVLDARLSLSALSNESIFIVQTFLAQEDHRIQNSALSILQKFKMID